MSALTQDLRYAFRTLGRAPGFAAIVVLTLGLGIGANTAIFSLLDQVLLRTLPVADPASLVQLDGPGPWSGRTLDDRTFSYPMYRDLRDQNTVFAGLVAQFGTPATVTIRRRSERVNAELVSGNTFEVLGVGPFVGRAFTDNDDRVPGTHTVVVLGFGYWQRRFAGDPGVVGASITINSTPMMNQFQGPRPAKRSIRADMEGLPVVGCHQARARELYGSGPLPSAHTADQLLELGTLVARPCGAAGGWGAEPPKASPVICARPPMVPMTDDASSGIMITFWFGALARASRAFT